MVKGMPLYAMTIPSAPGQESPVEDAGEDVDVVVVEVELEIMLVEDVAGRSVLVDDVLGNDVLTGNEIVGNELVGNVITDDVLVEDVDVDDAAVGDAIVDDVIVDDVVIDGVVVADVLVVVATTVADAVVDEVVVENAGVDVGRGVVEVVTLGAAFSPGCGAKPMRRFPTSYTTNCDFKKTAPKRTVASPPGLFWRPPMHRSSVSVVEKLMSFPGTIAR